MYGNEHPTLSIVEEEDEMKIGNPHLRDGFLPYLISPESR
jgi:hypothetical protein